MSQGQTSCLVFWHLEELLFVIIIVTLWNKDNNNNKKKKKRKKKKKKKNGADTSLIGLEIYIFVHTCIIIRGGSD